MGRASSASLSASLRACVRGKEAANIRGSYLAPLKNEMTTLTTRADSPRGNYPDLTVKRTQSNISMGSGTDRDLNQAGTFSEKARSKDMGSANPEAEGLWITCRKGHKPDTANQDSWYVFREDDFSVYGVFDGHGKKGHDVSSFIRRHLPQSIIQRWRKSDSPIMSVMKDAFAELTAMIYAANEAGKLDVDRSGSTATVVFHDHKKSMLTLAHVGDSGAALARGPSFKATYLTLDHKANLWGEYMRIMKRGRIAFDDRNYRVYRHDGRGGLNMSRSFGDLELREAGIISEPTISQVKLAAADHFLMVCSDGVWEWLKLQEVIDIVKQALDKKQNAASQLALETSDSWLRNEKETVDDITVVLVLLKDFNQPAGPPKPILKRSDTGSSSSSSRPQLPPSAHASQRIVRSKDASELGEIFKVCRICSC